MTTKWHLGRRRFLLSSAAAGAALSMPSIVRAQDTSAAIQKWVDEFQPSTLTQGPADQGDGVFIKAAKPYKGMEINVVSETLDTHVYEIQTLAKAFREITGIKLDARQHPGRRCRREDPDADAVGQEHLRRLDQRLRPDRHPLPLQKRSS